MTMSKKGTGDWQVRIEGKWAEVDFESSREIESVFQKEMSRRGGVEFECDVEKMKITTEDGSVSPLRRKRTGGKEWEYRARGEEEWRSFSDFNSTTLTSLSFLPWKRVVLYELYFEAEVFLDDLFMKTEDGLEFYLRNEPSFPPPLSPYPDHVSSSSIWPDHLLCPISLLPMRDPVVASDGHTYDRDSILRWIVNSSSPTSPLSKKAFSDLRLIPNWCIRKAILYTESTYIDVISSSPVF